MKEAIHKLIHMTDVEVVRTAIQGYKLSADKLKKFNHLRLSAGKESI